MVCEDYITTMKKYDDEGTRYRGKIAGLNHYPLIVFEKVTGEAIFIKRDTDFNRACKEASGYNYKELGAAFRFRTGQVSWGLLSTYAVYG